MTREQFIARRRESWKRFEVLLNEAETKRARKLTGAELSELSALFRELCYDLSLVQSRDWGTSIGRYLNGLATRGHNCIYRARPISLLPVLEFLAAGFPRLLRQNAAYFFVALALSVLPGLIAGVIVANDDSMAARIVPEQHQQMFDSMYDKDVSEGRTSDANSIMAGFYVYNNVGIAFRCFALGAFAGIGTMITLIYNSIFLGAVTGFMVARGHSGNFFEFVIGHGSFELTAIVVSGAAGLVLGHAIIHPGSQSRLDALRERGLVAVKIALGAGAMLVVAAGIEGFWSPSEVPRQIKFAVGGMLWLLVIAWLMFAGRTSVAPVPATSTSDRTASPLLP